MNFANRTLFINDNLPVLRGLNSDSVDLIYLDPPFNSKRQYKAPIGTAAEGQKFDDTWRWTDLDERWLAEIDRRNAALGSVINAARQVQGDGTAAYLTMMGIRLLEMRRVLKPDGGIYLHCDDTANSYLRLCMDAVFGRNSHRNEIVWVRSRGGKLSNGTLRRWPRCVDHILFYGNAALLPFRPRTAEEVGKLFNKVDETGARYCNIPGNLYSRYYSVDLPSLRYEWSPPDRPDLVFKHKLANWFLSKEKMDDEYAKGNIVIQPDGELMRRKYERDDKGKVVTSFWDDIPASAGKESTGWATQKPLALLQRIIKASSNPGDVVLDPFAGCATCCVAAEMEDRQWIGIEACENAADIIQLRLDEADLGELGGQSDISGKVTIDRRLPRRTDQEEEPTPRKRRPRGYKTPENMDILYGKQRGLCNGCSNHYRCKDLDFDHIVPQSRGGGDDLDNLQLLCGHCNSVKGDGTMDDLKRRLARRERE